MPVKTNDSPGDSGVRNYKNISEEELHEYAGRILHMMEEDSPEKRKFLQEILPKYLAVNEANKEEDTYPQDWQAYNEAQSKEKVLLMNLLDELLSYIQFPEHKGVGRSPVPMRDKIFYLTMQAYNIKSSRRCISDLEIAKRLGYVTKAPHFNTVLKILKDPSVTAYMKHLIQVSGIPLQGIEADFAVDSSGFSTSEFGRWLDVRTGSESDKRKYVKAHITCGVRTNIITAINITKGNYSDSPEFVPLIKDTSRIYVVREVSADKAYSSKENLLAASELGAIPFIPFKKNSTGKGGNSIWKKMYQFFINHPDEFYHHYHKRSNVESTFHMIKRKFGSHLKSRSETGQTNEILVKCLCHNLCVLIQEAFELRIDLDFQKCADIEIAHKLG